MVILSGSQQFATEVVLLSLPARLESPNALWRLFCFQTQAKYLFAARVGSSIAHLAV
jgi:hypothetical protein